MLNDHKNVQPKPFPHKTWRTEPEKPSETKPISTAYTIVFFSHIILSHEHIYPTSCTPSPSPHPPKSPPSSPPSPSNSKKKRSPLVRFELTPFPIPTSKESQVKRGFCAPRLTLLVFARHWVWERANTTALKGLRKLLLMVQLVTYIGSWKSEGKEKEEE